MVEKPKDINESAEGHQGRKRARLLTLPGPPVIGSPSQLPMGEMQIN